jgi:formate dehydrogenase iron-sulfur subunit
MKIFLPLDSAAVALGADEIALALLAQAQAKGIDLDLVRNGWPLGRWICPTCRLSLAIWRPIPRRLG